MVVLALRGRRVVWGALVLGLMAGGAAQGQVRPGAARLGEPVPALGPIGAGSAVLIVDPPQNGMDSDALLQRRINTHAATLGSEQHLRKVIGRAAGEVRKTHWFKESDSPIERAGWLRDHLRVVPLPGTALIQVSLEDVADAAERTAIVREVCQAYIEGQKSDRVNALLDRTQMLNNIRIKADARLKDLRADMKQKLIELNSTGGAVGGGFGRLGVKEIELSKVVQEQVDARLAYEKSQTAYQAAVEAVKSGRAVPGEDRMSPWVIPGCNPYLTEDHKQLRQSEVERDALAEKMGAENEAYQRVLKRVQRMREQFEKDREEAMTKARAAIVEDLKQEAEAAKGRFNSLTARVDGLRDQVGDLSNATVQYATLEREEKGLSEQIRSVKEQIEQVVALQSSAGVGEIRWHLYPEVTPVR
jgi:hypothetical protein